MQKISFNANLDLVQQTIRLFLELSSTAAELHNLGSDAGMKRTILLHLLHAGATTAEALNRQFPADPVHGESVIKDLMTRGLVMRTFVDQRPLLDLTLPGKKAAEGIGRIEADFFRQCGISMPANQVREASAVLETFLKAIQAHRQEEHFSRVIGM